MDDEARIRVVWISVLGVVLVTFIIAGSILLAQGRGAPATESHTQGQTLGSVVAACKTLSASTRGSCLANVAEAQAHTMEVSACNNLSGFNSRDCIETLKTGKPTSDRAQALEECDKISSDDQALQTCVEIALRTGKVKS